MEHQSWVPEEYIAEDCYEGMFSFSLHDSASAHCFVLAWNSHQPIGENGISMAFSLSLLPASLTSVVLTFAVPSLVCLSILQFCTSKKVHGTYITNEPLQEVEEEYYLTPRTHRKGNDGVDICSNNDDEYDTTYRNDELIISETNQLTVSCFDVLFLRRWP